MTKWDTVETLFLVNSVATTTTLGEKVTTVNLENNTFAQTLTFDPALTAATVGVNNVIGAAGAAVGVTVAGTALKTLTVDASGKVSNVTLTQAAIETLNITGKANLTLDAASTLTAVKTVDGSKAEGKLALSKLATMTSVKTGSGNDTVTIAAAASGDTINLGAGNDKLLKGAGLVATSTTTVIDGGAGIDSLDAALVTVGNAGVFANFETLSLTAGADLDLALVNKSTFTTIAIDSTNTYTVRNVSTSQSLAVNAAGTSTTLLFKDVTGTADAYTINFNADSVAAPLDAGTVSIEGIETVTVNSIGKTGATNEIDLKDASAKSLIITGDKELALTFNTAFGTDNALAGDGKGVTTIDASASTAGIKIVNLSLVGEAENGLTIKGGAGVDNIASSAAYGKAITIEAGAGDDIINTTNLTATANKIIVNGGAGNDIITVGATGGTLTGGAGNDKFVVTTAAGITPLTTITDIEKGDIISGVKTGVSLTKANISGVANLDATLAIAAATDNTNTWFQYGSDTYLVVNTTNVLDATDVIVKLNGLVDLSTSTVSTTDLTIA